MDWIQLLSKRLLGEPKQKAEALQDGRSQFQRDFDRIVFSSAFRRLQDKTQVFPLPESDFVHTRLTHSLEVSCVGRSLGNFVGAQVLNRSPKLKNNFSAFHFGEIVSAACLAHDIGNPPFGHSGEDAISEYFKNGNGKEFESKINDNKKWNDLTRFEGNAQGFRIITKLQNPKLIGGLRLTHATLGAFTKYPKESIVEDDLSENKIKKKLYSKFGYFQSEKNIFHEVANETGLLNKGDKNNFHWCRHPLAYLVEAADDICYRIMDLEDGFRLGLLTFNETEKLLMSLLTRKKLKSYKSRDENDKIGYLRAKVINSIVNETAEVFLDEEKNILSGKLEKDLISILNKTKELEEIKKISIEKIYSYKSVVEREAAGFEVLGGLLDIFITAVNEASNGKTGIIAPKNKTILKLLPKQFLNDTHSKSDLYYRLLIITDYISGMTDSYAVSLFRKIKGISLPER